MTDGAPRVAVIGSGAWGTTLALLVARSEPVTLLCHSPETAARLRADRVNERRLPGIPLPERVHATADAATLATAELVLVAVPSSHLRSSVAGVATAIPPTSDVLSVVKGLESGTPLRMTEAIADAGRQSRRAGLPRCPARTSPRRSPAACRRRRSCRPKMRRLPSGSWPAWPVASSGSTRTRTSSA